MQNAIKNAWLYFAKQMKDVRHSIQYAFRVPHDNHPPTEIPTQPLRFALHVTRDHRKWAIIAICAVLVANVSDAIMIRMLGIVTDSIAEAAETSDFSEAWKWAALYPLTYFFMQSFYRISGFCGMRWITGVQASAYDKLFAYLTSHSASYFSDRFAGALTSKIFNAAMGTTSLMMKFLWEFFPLTINFITYLFLAASADHRLAGFLFAWLMTFMTLNVIFALKKRPLAYHASEQASILKGKMVDSTSNIASVQQFARFSHEQSYVKDFINVHRSAHLRSWQASEWIMIMNGTMLTLMNAGMLLLSVGLLSSGSISVGSVVMMLGIAIQLQRSLFFIGMRMVETMDNYGQVEEGLDELLLPHEIKDKPGAVELALPDGKIEFDDVTFSYESNVVFRNFSLKIPGGQKVGLVGVSGAGKTTLIKLLLRSYELDEGALLFDGTNMEDVTLESLRQHIAMVPQDVSLFHRTIKENIRYGRLDATDEDVMQAAKLAEAHAFISSLPEGYDTLVGERGVKLSGGQRQRIAIARAICKNAKILIMDEATSSLDSESESSIQTALSHLMKDKTVIAIAHRLSTLKAMDRLIVLDQGKIVEDGSHAELLKGKGIYARLWRSQVGGFIVEQ